LECQAKKAYRFLSGDMPPRKSTFKNQTAKSGTKIEQDF